MVEIGTTSTITTEIRISLQGMERESMSVDVAILITQDETVMETKLSVGFVRS